MQYSKNSNFSGLTKYERLLIERSYFTYANGNSNVTYVLRIHLFPSINLHKMQKNTEKNIDTFLMSFDSEKTHSLELYNIS